MKNGLSSYLSIQRRFNIGFSVFPKMLCLFGTIPRECRRDVIILSQVQKKKNRNRGRKKMSRCQK